MITTKLVIPSMTSDDDDDDDDNNRETQANGHGAPSSELAEKEDLDAPSTTAVGSEGRVGKYPVHSLTPCVSSRPMIDITEEKASRSPGLSRSLLSQHDVLHSKPDPIEWIVVRIEVTDTGCGIHPKDMVQTKLFCMYHILIA